ncbi:hypothetical protein [Nostoc phage YongM]|nr:hypothetical protein [Nostoc phage YongM]
MLYSGFKRLTGHLAPNQQTKTETKQMKTLVTGQKCKFNVAGTLKIELEFIFTGIEIDENKILYVFRRENEDFRIDEHELREFLDMPLKTLRNMQLSTIPGNEAGLNR